MQKIVPCLWFDNNAKEAVNFYSLVFKNSRVGKELRYEEEGAKVSGMPEGSVMTVDFWLREQQFVALNGGPLFKFTPAVSFLVNCNTQEEIDELWEKLSPGGKVLMEFGKYPFSEKFGWVEDRFGISWQLTLTDNAQNIAPCLMFTGKQNGKAEEAINFYVSLFENSTIGGVYRYGAGEGGEEGTIKHAIFSLNGVEFRAMDSNLKHSFTFSEAISFSVNCTSQEEIDKFWEKLSDGGEEMDCGWVKDKYGVTWQIVPSVLDKMISDKDREKVKKVMHVMLQMKKLKIDDLKKAYESYG